MSMQRRFLRLFLLLAGLATVVSNPARGAAPDSPLAWLERMNHTLTHARYSATVVYAQGGQMHTIQVEHDGPASERLSSGEAPRQQVVDGRRFYAGQQAVALPTSADAFGGWSSAAVETNYRLLDRGVERINGRSAQRIDVQARDEHRWSYSVWIDQDHYLPLRWDWLDTQGDVTRQLRMTELRLGQRPDVEPSSTGVEPASNENPLRLGFTPLRGLHVRLSIAGNEVERFVLSDGLARVSIFKGPDAWLADEHEWPDQLGPVSLHRWQTDENSWLAMGEVPLETLRALSPVVSQRL